MDQKWPPQSQYWGRNQLARDHDFTSDGNDSDLRNTLQNPNEQNSLNKNLKPAPRIGRVLPRVMNKISESETSKVVPDSQVKAKPGSVIPCIVTAVRNPKKLKLSETNQTNLDENYQSNVTTHMEPPLREVVVHSERTVTVDKDDVIFIHQPGPSGVLKRFRRKKKKVAVSHNVPPVYAENYDQHNETQFPFIDFCPQRRAGVPFSTVGYQMPGETCFIYSNMLTATQSQQPELTPPSDIAGQTENNVDVYPVHYQSVSNAVPEAAILEPDPAELFLKTTQLLEPQNLNTIDTDRTSNISESELKQPDKDSSATEKYVPILEKPELALSTDRTVLKLAKHWPWDKEIIKELARVSYKSSRKDKSDIRRLLDRTAEESSYWVKVKVTGYPRTWDRQKMLDTLVTWQPITNLPFTPCFIEFTPLRTKFIVNKCSGTFRVLFSKGLVIISGDYRLNISVTELVFSQKELRFRLGTFLEYRFKSLYDNVEKCVDLSAFLLQPDISLMCHFPLCKIYNQRTVVEMPSQIKWREVTKLILASNRLTSLEGFDLQRNLPSLQELDISDNSFTTVSQLVSCQGCSATAVRLEGNPLCLNFIQQDEYTDAVKLIFPKIVYLDGVKMRGLPEIRRNYCPNREAMPLVEQFLEMYFALLECNNRFLLHRMYSAGAMLTLSCQARLRKLPEYVGVDIVGACRDARILNEVMEECFVGNESIADTFALWPPISHDATTFTIDVLSHTEHSLILTVTGSLRVLSDSKPDDCPLLDFMRTCVLSLKDGTEFVIYNDMWHLAEPTAASRAKAFAQPLVKPVLSLEMTSAPDDNLKNDLIDIFMKVTSLKRNECLKCLEMRNWDIKSALQYFMQLLQDNEVSTLSGTPKQTD